MMKQILRTMAIAALTLLALSPTHAIDTRPKPNSQQSLMQPPIRLTLSTSKAVYRVSQTIELTAFLENVSQEAYYVGSSFDFGFISSYHNMLLTIRDGRNREVGFPRTIMTSLWERDKLTTEEVRQAYILLGPGKIYGIKSKLELRLRPGTYHLTVTYRDDYAQSWSENKNVVLPYAVWKQPVVSNSVTVIVRQ